MTYRLSAKWMTDHIEVWGTEDECGPEPSWDGFRGNVWVGTLDAKQMAEIVNRCEYYIDCEGAGFEDDGLCAAAKRVIAAIGRQNAQPDR